MDHADDTVQRIAVNGQAAVAMLGERGDAIGKASAFFNRDNVAARHHDVVDAVLAEME